MCVVSSLVLVLSLAARRTGLVIYRSIPAELNETLTKTVFVRANGGRAWLPHAYTDLMRSFNQHPGKT